MDGGIALRIEFKGNAKQFDGILSLIKMSLSEDTCPFEDEPCPECDCEVCLLDYFIFLDAEEEA